MPLVNASDRGRREQPFSECVFAHTRSRCREKLKQAVLVQQIEIGGVYVMSIVETFPRLSRPLPSVFNASQTAFVKRHRSLGQLACSQQSRMPDRDARKSHDRSRQPPERKGMAFQRSPSQDHREEKEN